MIGVRTHENRWIVRDSALTPAHAMITRIDGRPVPVFRIVLCEPFEHPTALPVEAFTLDDAIAIVRGITDQRRAAIDPRTAVRTSAVVP